jgi:uncharacterized protein (DUF3820 family)
MALTDDSIMKFGKHKGKKLSEIPNGYFLYLYDRKMLSEELKSYVEHSVPVLRTKFFSTNNQQSKK